MHERPQLRLIFLVFALCLVLFSPLLIVFGPMFFPITFFYEKYTWFYYTPSINYYLFAIAIFLLFTGCILLFTTNLKKWAIASSIVLFVLASIVVVGSAFSYMKMSADGIKFQHIFEFEEQFYKWSDMEKVEYYSINNQDSGRPHFEFYFKDGNKYTFNETMHVELVRSSMNMMLRSNDVEIVYKDKSKVERHFE